MRLKSHLFTELTFILTEFKFLSSKHFFVYLTYSCFPLLCRPLDSTTRGVRNTRPPSTHTSTGTRWIEGWEGPSAGLDSLDKRKPSCSYWYLKAKSLLDFTDPESCSLEGLGRYTSTVLMATTAMSPSRATGYVDFFLIHEVLEFSYVRNTFITGSTTDCVGKKDCRNEHISRRVKLLRVLVHISASRTHEVFQSITHIVNEVRYGLGSYCGIPGYETVWSDRWTSTYRMNRDNATSGQILNMKGYVPLKRW